MFKSRLPQVIAELEAKMDLLAGAAAELIEHDAKGRVAVDTGKLRDRIHTEHEGPGEYAVVAGDNEIFYGHLVEHGGARTAGRPFMTPAAEQARAALPKLGAQILRNL